MNSRNSKSPVGGVCPDEDPRLTHAFKAHYRGFVQYVRRKLSRRRRDRKEFAEDIVSQAYLKLHERNRTEPVDDPTAFWATTLHHELSNAFRHEAVIRRTEGAVAATYPTVRTPERLALDEERRKKTWEALEQLPATHRAAVYLYACEGLKPREIVARLAQQGVSIGERQIERRVHAASEALAKPLAMYGSKTEEGHR